MSKRIDTVTAGQESIEAAPALENHQSVVASLRALVQLRSATICGIKIPASSVSYDRDFGVQRSVP